MKLAIDPETVECTELNDLADDNIVHEIASILDLSMQQKEELKEVLQKVYHEFVDAVYEIDRSLPEHKEQELLQEVYDNALQLVHSLNNLLGKGNADQRLGQKLKDYHNKQIEMHKAVDDTSFFFEKNNPNYNLRRTISNLAAAASSAVDAPYKSKTEELREALDEETNRKRRHDLAGEIAFNELADFIHHGHEEAYKKRVAARKTPKDLPLRNTIKILKEFIIKNTPHPFTAGKYYPEIGYKSPVFTAIKIALEKIYPDISDRKIASLMSELGGK
jgi:membrane-associated HD superfamily phosphohydrolase